MSVRQDKLIQLTPIKEALENYIESFPIITEDYFDVKVSLNNIIHAIEKVR